PVALVPSRTWRLRPRSRTAHRYGSKEADMATRSTGLGRGLGALIPSQPDDQEQAARPVDGFFSTGESSSSKTKKSGSASGATANDATPEASDLKTVPGARLAAIAPSAILPNANQPRKNFDPDELAELVHSVREFGVLQP